MLIKNSNKATCQACNRPFDPRSAGATPVMGPTCARRAGADDASGPEWQLGFALNMIGDAAPTAAPERRPTTPSARSSTRRQLPVHFKTDYDMAKMAFDELFREFCITGVLLTGERAALAEDALLDRAVEIYSLEDPSLTWLEPEHDLSLLVDPPGASIHYRRVFNGVVTLLQIVPARSAVAAAHVATIVAYVSNIRAFSREQDAVQLSLFDLG